MKVNLTIPLKQSRALPNKMEYTKVVTWHQQLKTEDYQTGQLRKKINSGEKRGNSWTAENLKKQKPHCWRGNESRARFSITPPNLQGILRYIAIKF